MKTTDKFLLGIVIGIVLLIIVALAVTLAQPEPAYQAEDTPEGVAHNYLLALQKGDYERAYGYLSPTIKGYPESTEKFIEHITDNKWRFRLDTENTLSVESVKIIDKVAIVKVLESNFSGGDLFNSGQNTTDFEMELHMENGEWKIVQSPYYFAWCWTYDKGCK